MATPQRVTPFVILYSPDSPQTPIAHRPTLSQVDSASQRVNFFDAGSHDGTTLSFIDELERQVKAAKQLRREFLLGVAVITKGKFAAQSRKLRTLEMSIAAAIVAVGVFWFTLLGAPKVTEADEPDLSAGHFTRLR